MQIKKDWLQLQRFNFERYKRSFNSSSLQSRTRWGYDDKTYVTELLAKGKDIETKTISLETEILKIVNDKIGV